MKKTTILSVPVILTCIVMLAFASKKTDENTIQKTLVGTWQMCNPDSTVSNNVYNATDIAEYKVITKETFMVCDFAPDRKTVFNSFWGTYTFENGVYTEYIQYTSPGTSSLTGKINSFQMKIENDLMFVEGINNHYNSIWKKVKN